MDEFNDNRQPGHANLTEESEESVVLGPEECLVRYRMIRTEADEERTVLNTKIKRPRSLLLDILAICFGIGSWIGITSVFLQMPLIVDKAPEGWALPSYLVVAVQMANIGPMAYTLLQKFSPKWIKDAYMIDFVHLVGVIASLLIGFLYEKTVVIGEQSYSLALYILVFLLAIVGCTSSVLFMPYMGRFREIYLTSYFIGEGLSGFLPSVVSLIQGVGGTECATNNTNATQPEVPDSYPLFTTGQFFIFVFCMILTSFIAFNLMHKLKICKKEYAAVNIINGNQYVYESKDTDKKSDGIQSDIKVLSPSNYSLLMILMAAICFLMNGILPSIQSYSCLPYGNLTYHLTASLCAMANPVAYFLGIFIPHKSIRSILVLASCSFMLASYVMVTAILSPHPPMVGLVWGEVLVITSWTLLYGFVSFTKLGISTVMRSQGGKSLVWTGAVSQAGSATGSVFIFVLINYTSTFTSYNPCQ